MDLHKASYISNLINTPEHAPKPKPHDVVNHLLQIGLLSSTAWQFEPFDEQVRIWKGTRTFFCGGQEFAVSGSGATKSAVKDESISHFYQSLGTHRCGFITTKANFLLVAAVDNGRNGDATTAVAPPTPHLSPCPSLSSVASSASSSSPPSTIGCRPPQHLQPMSDKVRAGKPLQHYEIFEEIARKLSNSVPEPVIMAIDLEVQEYGKGVKPILQIGIARGTLRGMTNAINIVITDNMHIQNKKAPVDHTSFPSAVGKTLRLGMCQMKELVQPLLNPIVENGAGYIVGHTIHNDIKWLGHGGVKLNGCIGCDLAEVERYLTRRSGSKSLVEMADDYGVDEGLGLKNKSLEAADDSAGSEATVQVPQAAQSEGSAEEVKTHNAGNDAVMTFELFRHMMLQLHPELSCD
jgi:hypothetical protein